jgi:hypothetical protein
MTDYDETGAIDYIVIEFERREITGELVPSLLDLVDRRLIRIMDVLIVRTASDGSFETLTPDQLDPAVVGDLGALAGASSGLLTDDDAAAIAGIMAPEAGALVLVYENLWSLPFATAARKAGGQVVALGHIPTQAIVAALDALDALDA